MARYRRSDQIEVRVADEIEVGDVVCTVDLIAKKATGVDGYRMTLSCVQVDGPESRFVQLEPAGTREEAEDTAHELAADRDRLRDLLRPARE